MHKKRHLDTIVPGKGNPKQQIKQSKQVRKQLLKRFHRRKMNPKSRLVDTTVKNKYGDLLNDDIKFNKKYPVWKPAVEVLGINAFTYTLDRYILNESFSHVGWSTWKYNIQKGWEWDSDRFGINFVGHPYSGSMYFNAARSQGYSYIQSLPFAVGGSLIWEYFGENTRPSYNDVINTPVNGAFLGEIFYRVSSNILDDRVTGGNRVFREVVAGIIDPVRGLNRLLQGKSFRHTTTQVYQQEPLNVTLSAGVHKINEDNKTIFGNGPTNALLNVQLDYGIHRPVRRGRDPFRGQAERDVEEDERDQQERRHRSGRRWGHAGQQAGADGPDRNDQGAPDGPAVQAQLPGLPADAPQHGDRGDHEREVGEHRPALAALRRREQ